MSWFKNNSELSLSYYESDASVTDISQSLPTCFRVMLCFSGQHGMKELRYVDGFAPHLAQVRICLSWSTATN